MQFSSISKRIGLAILIPAMALAFFEPLPARADSADDANGGVARISVVSGTVAIERGDSQTTVAAVANAPVLGADYVTTGNDGRAEIQFDGHSAIRLGEDVQMRFTRVDNGTREMQLAQGAVELRLLGGVDGTTSIDTPSITVHPQEGGAYRVTVTSDGTTQVTVRSGRADIETPQGNQSIGAGSTLVATGAASSPQITSIDPIALDGFDEFNHQLDVNEQRVTADAPYVNTDIQGVSDLDRYGRWVNDGTYGHVWVPSNTEPDWAPYRTGRWVWEEGYGYTWVAVEPWGWAPYHYGRWYRSAAYGWAWYPPAPRVYTPWSPALVGFIGFGGGGGFNGGVAFGGGGIGINFAFGNVGWVPLAPREAFTPWWGRGRGGNYYNNSTHITNITNVTNVTNNTYYGRRSITNVYQNARYANAVTGQSSQNFTRGNFTRNVAITQSQLVQGQAVRGALPIVPSQANLRYSDRAVPDAFVSRPHLASAAFAGRGTVPQRTSFESQRSTFATAQHLKAPPIALQNTAAQRIAPEARIQTNRIPQSTTVNSAGQALGNPSAATATTRRGPQTATASSPWDRFGASRTPASATRLDQRNPAPAEGVTARQNALPTNSVPAGNGSANARSASTSTEPWSRFGQSRGTNGTSQVPTQRSYPSDTGRTIPNASTQRSYPSDTARTYPNATTQRSYPSDTARTYPNATTQRTYPSDTARTYPNATTQRTYPSDTARTYPNATTQRTYPNPTQRTYPTTVQRTYPNARSNQTLPPSYRQPNAATQGTRPAPPPRQPQARPPANEDRHPH